MSTTWNELIHLKTVCWTDNCRSDGVTTSSMMMPACLLQHQQASVSAALPFPSYFTLLRRLLPTSSSINGIPHTNLLSSLCLSSPSPSLLSTESQSYWLVMFVISCSFTVTHCVL